MKAGVYSRVNTPGDEGGTSMELQEAASVAMAQSQGYEVPEEFRYREVESGIGLRRRQLDKLRAAAARGEIRAVFVFEPSRLGRNPLELLRILDELREAGVAVLFLGDYPADPA